MCGRRAPTSASASVNPTCGGATTLSVSGGSAGTGGTLQWYTGSCGGTSVGSGNLSVSPSATTTYYGRYETAAPCSDVTGCAQVTVTVNTQSANPTSAAASVDPVCTGGSTLLTLTGGGGGTGEVIKWYAGACSGTAVATGNGASVSPTTTTTYYGRYEDGAPCSFNTACATVTVTVNCPPVANPDTFMRTPGMSLKIPKASLLANDTDESVTNFVGVSATSTNGVTLTTYSTFILYPRAHANVNDQFTYTITDGSLHGHGRGERNHQPQSRAGRRRRWSLRTRRRPWGLRAFRALVYEVQRATNMVNPTWVVVLTTNAPPAGVFRGG